MSEKVDDRDNPAALAADEQMDGDQDFYALHRLVTTSKLQGADVDALRALVKDYKAHRLHAALDRVLDRIRERRCTGDRFSRRRV